MVVVQAIPNTVIENALNALRSLGKDSSRYSFTVDNSDECWLVHFRPLNPNARGGETKIRIAKDTLEVLEILRYQ